MSAFNKLTKMKILLIDDDELIRDSLSIAFKSKGCWMWAVESAEEGLNALQQDKFDIVISDLRLPGMNGLEALRSAIKFQPGIRAVLITAYGERDIAIKASEAGVHGFIEKPFLVGALFESLERLIKSQQAV